MATISRSNESWLEALRIDAPTRSVALKELRLVLVRGLKGAFKGKLGWQEREFPELFDDFAQEALLKILDNLDSFQGLSQFTTWAHKICIRIAYSELRRLRWKDVSLDAMMESGYEGGAEWAAPEPQANSSDMMEWMKRAMREELTEKQQQALHAVAFMGMPMSEVARRMDTNRNALYKLLHDARLKLKQRLQKDGMAAERTT